MLLPVFSKIQSLPGSRQGAEVVPTDFRPRRVNRTDLLLVVPEGTGVIRNRSGCRNEMLTFLYRMLLQVVTDPPDISVAYGQ